ncbi:nose resistant to fluoxetine protein 6 isoform X1 [Chironomus tepperi]|uniref:nose resistant to fluoxetine protein 6 isoform X1 n=1 Tax=Chironomus tepperi TaxID=113505 RepID=UPI00391F0610
MMQYLDGLQIKKTWAIKMDDASSGFSSGYFWGNNYWMGSMALCRSIYKHDENHHYRKQSSNVGLTFINGNTAHVQMKHENPPFLPRFSVLRVILSEVDIAPNPRTIHVGVCLPTSCEKDDIIKIADSARDSNETKFIKLDDVRIPNADGFTLWKDSTFITMLTVTLVVGIFIVWGTAYDILLRKKAKQRRQAKSYSKDLHSDSSGLNCTTYDLTSAITDKSKSNCVGIGIPSGINNNNSDENLAAEPSTVDEDKLPIYEELLLSFSLVTNFKAICDREVGSDTISCIHGIRAFSMVWIILGHTCIIAFKYSNNMELRKVVEQGFFFQTITNGAFSVDTFFFISGFLVSFIYFRSNAKGNLDKLSKGVNEFTSGAMHFGGLVCYRFIRLTAPYIYTMGLVTVTMKYFASNSVFEPPTHDHINCPKYWWRNVLYINTLFPVQDMCMLWSWYLANDTQFYIIGAIILIIAIKHFKFAATTLTVFLLSAWITTGVIAYRNNHIPNTDDPLALFDKIYDKPWTRIGPYLVGMVVGWILFKTNCKIKFTKAQLVTGWTFSIGTLLYLLYGLFKVELSKFSAAAYSSLSHSAWAMALAWIVIACSTGHGGVLNKFLSATCLYPFSRVTYCAYLVHPIIIRAFALINDAPIHMGVNSVMTIFMGQTVASYLLSFIVSLAFEAPVVTMLKILVPNKKSNIIYKDTAS